MRKPVREESQLDWDTSMPDMNDKELEEAILQAHANAHQHAEDWKFDDASLNTAQQGYQDPNNTGQDWVSLFALSSMKFEPSRLAKFVWKGDWDQSSNPPYLSPLPWEEVSRIRVTKHTSPTDVCRTGIINSQLFGKISKLYTALLICVLAGKSQKLLNLCRRRGRYKIAMRMYL